MGHYRPGPMRHVRIPKPEGGFRPLDIPCIPDRIIQTAVATLIGPLIDQELESSSFAYRPGRGVSHAVAAVARARRDGFRWTAEGDVRRCFEEIPHDPLLERLYPLLGDDRLAELIALWLECHAPGGIGIPQGSPISPLLCNLHLDWVDESIAGNGIRLIRYADDFVILAKTAGAAESALERMAALLRQRGLELHPDKTQIRAFDQSLRFLGHLFVRSMVLKEVRVDDPPALPDAPTEDELAQWRIPPPVADHASEPPDDSRGASRVLYLLEPRARLSVRNQSFVANLPGDGDAEDGVGRPRFQVHAGLLDRIEIGPGTSADWAVLELAAAYQLPVVQVDGWGEAQGWWGSPGDHRARRTMAQARWLASDEQRDRLAQTMAVGRVFNQRQTLKKLNLKRKDAVIAKACVDLAHVLRRLKKPMPQASARAHEGSAGKIFWPAYARLFDTGFGFGGARDRRPPADPVNACLGYLYALLERDVRCAILRVGLHPGIGALHVERDGGDALVYDLMEAFRAPITETLLVSRTSRGVLRPDMFVIRDEIGEDGTRVRSCRIEPAARKALIRAHESTMLATTSRQKGGRSMPWRAVLEEEARNLAHLFEGRAEAFVPFAKDY